MQAFSTTQANAITATQLGGLDHHGGRQLLDHAARRAEHDADAGLTTTQLNALSATNLNALTLTSISAQVSSSTPLRSAT